MEGPFSPKKQDRGARKAKAKLNTGIGLNRGSSGSHNNEGNNSDRGKNALTLPPSSKRLSDVSSGTSTVTSACHHSDSGSVLASPEMQVASFFTSPRQNELIHTPKSEGRQTWSAVPSIGELENVHSHTKGLVVTPHTAAYICRSARESQISGPTTARSTGTARTLALGEEYPDWAGFKEVVRTEEKTTEVGIPSYSKEEKIEEEVPSLLAEKKTSIQPTPRFRRQPWIGPTYTAVHTPPYAAQTWEYGQTENLLDPSRSRVTIFYRPSLRESRHPERVLCMCGGVHFCEVHSHHALLREYKRTSDEVSMFAAFSYVVTAEPGHLSNVEQFVLEQSIEQVGRRQCVSLSGRPHFTPYIHRAPAVNSYLEDYAVPPSQNGHSFDKDPLLRSVLTPQDNFPYIREQATYHGQPLNYTHNDWMLDNVMNTTTAEKRCPGAVPTYADIPHFGRVQCTYLRQPDGTVYPLVTLPKMTPHDILKVLDRMKHSEYRKTRKPPFWRRLFCCGIADTGEV